jgi:hypothetical protein
MTVIDYLTAILVFVTTIYSYLTYKMAKASESSVQAMREQSEAMLRPYVTIAPFVRPNTTVLYLRIENTGRTAAENLQLSIDKDFFQFGEAGSHEKNIRTKAAFSEQIKSLPPGGKLIFALAQGFIIFGAGTNSNCVPQQFTITAKYLFGGKEFNEINHIDLRPYIGSEGEHDPVVEELEKLRKVAEKWNIS